MRTQWPPLRRTAIGDGPTRSPAVLGARPTVLVLGSEASLDPALSGAKAASLARAHRAGLPVVEGFVITTHVSAAIRDAGGLSTIDADIRDEILSAYRVLSWDGGRPLVVRSSSTVEDSQNSSMAGMFLSLLDVRGWDRFEEAVVGVASSRPAGVDAPMAVLVQPYLRCQTGGVLFGMDPADGDPRHIAIVAVSGGPESLVSGKKTGQSYRISKSGRAIALPDSPLLARRQLHSLARLSNRSHEHFGAPQDIEWGWTDRQLVLFQSRPITATGARVSGPIFGPGPVAETFPDALSPLESDLWVEPLKQAIRSSLTIVKAASRRAIRASPIIIDIHGWVAADLDLMGMSPSKRSIWSRLDPRVSARKLGAAWTVGRLRLALPSLAENIVKEVDARLERVPDVRELSDPRLVNLMLRARETLVTLHGYEILCGMLLQEGDEKPTAASLGLRALGSGRSEGRASLYPEVLSLLPPKVGPAQHLPERRADDDLGAGDISDLGPREALRLRIRWVQELSARAAWESGNRWVAAGKLRKQRHIRQLALADVVSGVIEETAKLETGEVACPPLPTYFRMAADGTPVTIASGESRKGQGAGGGRGMGHVHRGRNPAHGDVLVVKTLDPQLAPLLPSLGGLVAEAGSPLSHLAILARELRVPTVVGSEGALRRFPEGTVVVVDGTTGEVTEIES